MSLVDVSTCIVSHECTDVKWGEEGKDVQMIFQVIPQSLQLMPPQQSAYMYRVILET